MKITVSCEEDLLNAAEQIIASKMAFENRITAGCCTIAEIAKQHHMKPDDMNSFLCDIHILQKKGRRYQLAPKPCVSTPHAATFGKYKNVIMRKCKNGNSTVE